jgi:ankyrin repeat protein
MPGNLPTRQLREHPDLDQLKRQAKELLDAYRAGDRAAVAEVDAHYRIEDPASFALHDAQLVIGRAYGFDSWPKLKAYVDGVTVRRLADAVREGDFNRVQWMLDVRPELVNLDMAENNEHKALHYAVFSRSPEMVRLLMSRGADAHAGIYPHRRATTALVIANERGYSDIVAIIKQEEQRRRAGGTPVTAMAGDAPDELAHAISSGKHEHALAMIESDPALVNSCARDGWTPLHRAAAMRNARLAEWLIEHGADVNRQGPRGRTALDNAAGGEWTSTEVDGQGFAEIAKLLLQHGAERTARAAVALGEEEWLRARHAEGTLDNPIESWGGLLTLAVMHDQPSILALLLDLGFDPNERKRLDGVEEVFYSQAMPLWRCAATGKFAMAEMLLQRGAHPNVHVYASGSPVYSAVDHGDWTMVELLQRYGGIVDPVTVGLFKDRERARKLLADEAAGKPLPPGILEGRNVSEDLLRGSADSGDVEILRMALPGVDWGRTDDRWFWILMQAVWAASPACLALLLERCDPNLRHPRFGRTILHDVAGLGGEKTAQLSPDLAALLVDAGAGIGERDDILKSTPLGWACRWGRAGLVKLLLSRGADPIEADAEEWAQPVEWARKMGHDEVLGILREYGA